MIAVMLLALVATLAVAQQTSDGKAIELAQRLGRQRDAGGLLTILESRNVELLDAFARGMRESGNAPLPADIEALVVRFYADPVLGPPLRSLATQGRRYQTRALFDLLLADWKRRPGYGFRSLIFQTDLAGVEGALLEWLASSSPPPLEDAQAVIYFLGQRKYVPAIPLLERIGTLPADIDLVNSAAQALVRIGTPASVEASLRRIEEISRVGSPRSKELVGYLVTSLSQVPADVPIPYERVKAIDGKRARTFAANWLSQRKDLGAAPDVLSRLGEPGGIGAIDPLIASDSPVVWRQAREELERLQKEGRLDANAYRYAAKRLDEKIADPAAHFAEQARQERYRQYSEKKSRIFKSRNDAYPLKAKDPAAWFEAMRNQLQAWDDLARKFDIIPTPAGGGDAGELAREYQLLGDFARFRLLRAKDAVELYRASELWGGGFAALSSADTLQFDLKDRSASLAIYRRLLDQAKSPPDSRDRDQPLRQWMVRWLEAQVDWLARGQRFAGALTEMDYGPAEAAFIYGAASGADGAEGEAELRSAIAPLHREPRGTVDRERVRKALESLPPSSLMLLRTLAYVGFMPDAESLLRFLERNDPAGYATASLFALVVEAERNPSLQPILQALEPDPSASQPLRVAARQFLDRRKITVASAASCLGRNATTDANDPETPARVYESMRAKLKSGDIDAALSCFTTGARAKFAGIFRTLGPKLPGAANELGEVVDVRILGDSLATLQLVRQGKDGAQRFEITLVRSQGEWRISEM